MKTRSPGDDYPTRCQGLEHPEGEPPPAALGTYDLTWSVIGPNGDPGPKRTAVRRLCPDCKARREALGVAIHYHRFT